MSKYRLILDWHDKPLSNLITLLATVGVYTDQVSLETEEPIQPRVSKKARNEEIIRKYTSDPKLYSSVKLSEEYGISRERICQILRPINAIGNAQARREAAREAHAEARDILKTQTAQEWEEKIAKALEYIRKGMSIRKAAVEVGLEAHSNLTNLISKKARLAGIRTTHGRFRDFSERKSRARSLHEKGFSIPELIKHMRANGDPHINEPWVYKHLPELKTGRRK